MQHKVAALKSRKELVADREALPNVNEEHEKNLSTMDRLAVWITERVGTMGFFFIIGIWTLVWLTWNFVAPKNLQFDPPMSFVFWLFISNCIQILLMPLIMVGQNVQGAHAELRAQHDYEVNCRAAEEVDVILKHLEHHEAMLQAIMEKNGIADRGAGS